QLYRPLSLALGLCFLVGCSQEKQPAREVVASTAGLARSSAPSTSSPADPVSPQAKEPDPSPAKNTKPEPPPDKAEDAATKSKKAIAAIEKLGDFVIVDDNVWKVSIFKNIDAVVKLLPDLERVDEIEARDLATDAHLAAFARFKGLRRLEL